MSSLKWYLVNYTLFYSVITFLIKISRLKHSTLSLLFIKNETFWLLVLLPHISEQNKNGCTHDINMLSCTSTGKIINNNYFQFSAFKWTNMDISLDSIYLYTLKVTVSWHNIYLFTLKVKVSWYSIYLYTLKVTVSW